MATIPGLYNKKDFITEQQEQELIDFIYQQPWNTSLSRRTQHYGYLYDYHNTSVLKSTTPIPPLLLDYKVYIESIIESASESKSKTKTKIKTVSTAEDMTTVINFDQCIVNEYTDRQGIAPHIDHVVHFGPVIASLSLGSPCIFDFSRDEQECEITLDRCELLVLTGEARYKWKHAIAKGNRGRTGTRISITFRCVNKQ